MHKSFNTLGCLKWVSMLSVIVSSSCCIILQCDINFIACTCYKARQIAFSALILQKFRMWSHGGPWFCMAPNVVLWTLGIQFEIYQTGASQNVIVVVVKHRSSSLRMMSQLLCINQCDESMFGNVFCSRQSLFLYNWGVCNWVSIFSMNISSVHLN
jgi:hypothetical protein